MRRILIIAIFVLTMCTLPAAAQSLPTKKEAADLVVKAQKQMQLTGPGATPFHVLAKIRYTVGSASFDGDYELLWASADRYREAFRLGPLLSVYVATQNKLHIQRNSPTLTYMQWRVRELMNLPEPKSVDSRIDIGKVFTSQRGSQDAVC